MVDVIDRSLRVDELNEILDNLNDVFFGQNTDIGFCVKTQFFVDAVATYIAQVISFFRKEKILDNFTGRSIIGRVGISQLAIDIEYSLLLRVTGVFLQGVEDD